MANGELMPNRPIRVHDFLKHYEKYILVNEVYVEELAHPDYGYPVEEQSFIQWPKQLIFNFISFVK